MKRILLLFFFLVTISVTSTYAQKAKAEVSREGGGSYRVSEQHGVGVLAELVLSPVSQASLVVGYHFNPHFFWGGGVGLFIPWFGGKPYIDSTIPVFADMRVSFGDWRWSPYLGAKVGFFPGQKATKRSFEWKEDMYLSPSIGVRLRNRDRSKRSSFWLALATQLTYVEWPYIPFLQLGYSF